MRYLTLIAICMILSSCAPKQSPGPWTDNFNEPRSAAIVLDAREFIIKRQGCDHFRGEPGYDAERQKFINEQTTRLCKGTDAELRHLREKYKNKPETIRALAEFEECIEYATPCPIAKAE